MIVFRGTDCKATHALTAHAACPGRGLGSASRLASRSPGTVLPVDFRDVTWSQETMSPAPSIPERSDPDYPGKKSAC